MTRVTAAAQIASLLATLALAGCSAAGTSTSSATPEQQAVAVAVTPSGAQVQVGKTQAFQAVVTGSVDTTVSWAIAEGTAGGSVSGVGLYTAPGAAGTYHVVATSNADPTKSASAAVTVTTVAPPPVVTVAVSPAAPAVDACKTVAFSATVTGSSNTAVTWSVQEGAAGGTVSAAGLYTAPSTGGTYHVVATSNADPTKSVTVAATVTARVIGVAVSPATISVPAGGSTTFSATVTTTCGSVTALRTIDSNGVITGN
jgi:hypothetical protein